MQVGLLEMQALASVQGSHKVVFVFLVGEVGSEKGHAEWQNSRTSCLELLAGHEIMHRLLFWRTRPPWPLYISCLPQTRRPDQ